MTGVLCTVYGAQVYLHMFGLVAFIEQKENDNNEIVFITTSLWRKDSS